MGQACSSCGLRGGGGSHCFGGFHRDIRSTGLYRQRGRYGPYGAAGLVSPGGGQRTRVHVRLQRVGADRRQSNRRRPIRRRAPPRRLRAGSTRLQLRRRPGRSDRVRLQLLLLRRQAADLGLVRQHLTPAVRLFPEHHVHEGVDDQRPSCLPDQIRRLHESRGAHDQFLDSGCLRQSAHEPLVPRGDPH